jgi:hypothetical protein
LTEKHTLKVANIGRFFTYRETSAEIRRIKPKDRRSFQPRLSAQEADDVGFHPIPLSVKLWT